MRNGSVALGIGILVIGILAVEGKLQALWTAIMHGANATGPTAQNLGTGVYPGALPSNPSGPLAQNLGSGVYNPPPSNTVPATITVAATPSPGERYPIPITGSNPAFDAVYFHWPAGYDVAWQQFLGCYRQNGSIAACAGWIHSDLPKG